MRLCDNDRVIPDEHLAKMVAKIAHRAQLKDQHAVTQAVVAATETDQQIN